MRLTTKKLRYIGLGFLIVLIVLIALTSTVMNSMLQKGLRQAHQLRQAYESADALSGSLMALRAKFSIYVTGLGAEASLDDIFGPADGADAEAEDTGLSDILQLADSLILESDKARTSFKNKRYALLVERFSENVLDFKTAVTAYTDEKKLGSTGEGLRSWENKLVEIEEEAHAAIRDLKNEMLKDISRLDSQIVNRGERARNVSLFLGFVGVLSALYTIYLLNRLAIRPVRELVKVAEAVSDGDLRVEVRQGQDDDTGELASALLSMIIRLRGVITEIQAQSKTILKTEKVLGKQSELLSAGSSHQQKAIKSAEEEMNRVSELISDIDASVHTLSEGLDDSSASTLELNATIREVSHHADNALNEVETINGSIVQMNENIGKLVDILDSLAASSEEMSSSAEALTVSSAQVGNRARESTRLAAEVSQMAVEKGLTALDNTVRSSEQNTENAENYSRLIHALGQKSEAIEEILDVIRGVADQTNLLSLNAAIIAAQAGEHGQTFTVVADEIGKLSNATTENVQQIEDVIRSVRADVAEAVENIEQVTHSARESTGHARDARKVLKAIVEISGRSAALAGEIASEADNQLARCNEIVAAVSTNSLNVMESKAAMDRERADSAKIVEAVEQLRVIAKGLKTGTEEQVEGTRIISKTLTDSHSFSVDLMGSMDEKKEALRKILDSLRMVTMVANNNLSAMKSLDKTVMRLSEHSNRLAPQVDRFILPEVKAADEQNADADKPDTSEPVTVEPEQDTDTDGDVVEAAILEDAGGKPPD